MYVGTINFRRESAAAYSIHSFFTRQDLDMVGFAELKESESSSSSSGAVAEGRSVACDRIFLSAATLALGPPTLLKDHSKVLCRLH